MEQGKYLVKVEGNLIEYPFFHLGGRKDKLIKCKEYEFGEILLEDGSKIKRRLVVENYKEGIPGPYDQDVLMGILKIGTEKSRLTGDIPLTIYEVAKEIDDVSNWIRVRRSIERLVNTSYKSVQAILVKESGRQYYLTDLFHILESARFLDETEINKRQSNKVTKVRFNEFFIINFLNDYYKYINLKDYLKLRSPVAKKLYMYLEKKKFGKDKYQVKLDNLAGILPLEVSEYYRIRSVLKKASEKLIEESIIKGFGFEKEKIVYYFPKVRDERAMEKEEEPGHMLVKRLEEIGVTRKVAENLIKRCRVEVIEKQLEYLKFRKGDNLPGLLVKAITEDWAAPQEYVKKQREEDEALKAVREEEVQREERVKKEAFEAQIEEIIKNLSEDELNKYHRMAEEHYRRDNPGSDMKYFARGYRDSLIKRFVAEEKGLCV